MTSVNEKKWALKEKTRSGRKHYIYLSLALSASLIYILLRQVKLEDFWRDVKNIFKGSLFLYIFLHSICVIVRAYRFRLLIGSKRITLSDLVLVSLIRNIFVDLLPAKIGSLSYIYLIVKRFRFPFEIGASSFLLALLFDFLAVTPMLIFAVVAVGFGESPLSSPFFLFSVCLLFIILVLILVRLVPIMRVFMRIVDSLIRKVAFLKKRKIALVYDKLNQTVREVEGISRKGLYTKVFFSSLIIRVLKYSSLYFLLHSVLAGHGFSLQELSFHRVFLAFAGPEIASNLPVHGIGGFGTWELAWLLTFRPMGFSNEIAIRTGFIVHGITQVVEYVMGIVAIIILAFPFHLKARKS